MNLNTRVIGVLVGIILLTVVGAWLLSGRLVLMPFVGSLMLERTDMAVYMANEIERSPDPVGRAAHLSKDLDVEIQLLEEAPMGDHPMRGMHRHGKGVWLGREKQTPVYVPLEGVRGYAGILVFFPLDLDRPLRHVAVGLGTIGLVVLLGAFLASRWVLNPLVSANEAMSRVAGGDLTVRLREGDDVTGRMGVTFNHMARQVEGLVTGQRRLMAAVSHELRTPLARLRLSAELLRDDGASEGRVQALEADIAEVDQLVGEILESARLTEGVVALRRETVLVNELVDTAVAQVALEGRELAVEIDSQLPPVSLDFVRFVRVIVNLLSNAERYTPPGSHVWVKAWLAGTSWRLSVADDGPGVPAEMLSNLFEPFFRVESSRNRETGGLGLGLMLVRQIVEAHGGAVEAHLREGGGLILEMSLPVSGSCDPSKG